MIHEYLEMAWGVLTHPFVDHLVQSTLCVAAAAALAFALRGNGASTRYWIWLAASLKFLVPFSFLLSLGSRLSGLLPAQPNVRFSLFIEQIGDQTASAIAPLRAASRVSSETTFAAIALSVWFAGFAIVALFWLWRWITITAAVRNSADYPDGVELQAFSRLKHRAGVRTPIRMAKSSAMLWGPAVLGIFRSTLVLPDNLSLDAAQLESVLAHEIAHVRRRDNLFAAVHMLVEAMFWFHPLVWWLGAKLMTERERACDEEVLRRGAEPEAYAEGILRVCKLSIASPLACVSGITGADLKRRIQNIMSYSEGPRLSRAKKTLLSASGIALLLAPIGAGLFAAPRGSEQIDQPNGRPEFAVASIKPADPDARGINLRFDPGGRLSASSVTLRFLIKIAYDLRDDQIGGGPAWFGSKRFNLEGKCDPALPGIATSALQTQIRLRLQSLLAERFQLTFKEERKDMPSFQLVVSKNGPKMKEETGSRNGMRIHNTQMEATEVDMDQLAKFLGEQTSRTVTNQTGLPGHYSFKLAWSPDPALSNRPVSGSDAPAASDQTGPSLFTAVSEQLGLKLVPHKDPAVFVFVERAELPSAN